MSQATEDRETRMLGARVDEEMHRRVRLAAAEADKSIAQYLRDLLDEEVPEY